MKNFYVYKVTNTINEKYYIGVHYTSNPYDSYLGSGRTITKAVNKYGPESFKKEILFETENKDEAYLKEEELVSDNWNKDPNCYNEMPGGFGGFGHIDTKGDNNCMRRPEIAKKNVEAKRKSGGYKSEKFLESCRMNFRLATMKNTGTKKSKETREKLSKSIKEAHWRPEVREKYLKAMDKKRHHYRLLDPEGNEHIIKNVTEWCAEREVGISTITTKNNGYKIRRGKLRHWRVWITK
jgi:hypothetical protein